LLTALRFLLAVTSHAQQIYLTGTLFHATLGILIYKTTKNGPNNDILKTETFCLDFNLARFFDALVYSPETSVLSDQIANGKVLPIEFNFDHGLFFSILAFFTDFLYGILLRRLYSNYKELKN
jgi:hypothetical protein